MSNSNVPARIFDVSKYANPHWSEEYPATGAGAAQFFGQDVVPHISTSMGRIGLTSKAYLSIDEATNHSIVNAERMRKDCGIMECLEGRQRSTALLNWHIEPEYSKSQDQKPLAEELTRILTRTARFTELRRFLLEAIWFGRYGAAVTYSKGYINGLLRTYASRAEPRHGDKLVFRYDDGEHTYPAGQVGIRSVATTRYTSRLRESDPKSQVQYTEQGMVYTFNFGTFQSRLAIAASFNGFIRILSRTVS